MSHCGGDGHNSRTCGGGGAKEIVLFGVRVKVDPMRKSVSLNNLSQYELPSNVRNDSSKAVGDDGYASADDAVLPHHSIPVRHRRRGVPWTEEEHKLFLIGLQSVGKGDWRGIARNFVKTRTPTQVASHAQKYFLRRNKLSGRRRRSSLFDITTDSVANIAVEVGKTRQNTNSQRAFAPSTSLATTIVNSSMTVPVQIEKPTENLTLGLNEVKNFPTMLIHSIPVLAPSPPMATDVTTNQQLTLKQSALSLRLSLPQGQTPSSSRHIPFQVVYGDSMIGVA